MESHKSHKRKIDWEALLREEEDDPSQVSDEGLDRILKRIKRRRLMRRKSQPFRFLDLPAELRNQIYELALTEPEGLTITDKYRIRYLRRTIARGKLYKHDANSYGSSLQSSHVVWLTQFFVPNMHPTNQTDQYLIRQHRTMLINLLATCRQVRQEGEGILYGQPLIFADMTAALTFAINIGEANRKHLRNITIMQWNSGHNGYNTENYAALSSLADCVNLRSLYIDAAICNSSLNDPVELARTVYQDASSFFRAMLADDKRDIESVRNLIRLADWNFDRKNFMSSAACPIWWPWAIPERTDFKQEYEQELYRLLSNGGEAY